MIGHISVSVDSCIFDAATTKRLTVAHTITSSFLERGIARSAGQNELMGSRESLTRTVQAISEKRDVCLTADGSAMPVAGN